MSFLRPQLLSPGSRVAKLMLTRVMSTVSDDVSVEFRKPAVAAQAETGVEFKALDSKQVITLSRQKHLNALNLQMIRELYPKLQKFESDADIKLVIMKGAGDKAFCAGGDVRAVVNSGKEGTSICRDFFREEYQLNYLIGTYGLPFVAIIDGITMGGGVGLSVHGMFRVASDKTVFAMPETAIGLFPDVGGSYFLPRLRGRLGLFLALTGHRLIGPDVFHAGVATHYVNRTNLPALEDRLEKLRATDKIDKESVGQILQEYHEKSDDLGSFNLAAEEERINRLFGGGSVEEIMDNLEKDGSSFAKKHLGKLQTMSPTSMKITFRAYHEGASMDFKDIFTMEYRLAQRFVDDKKDFYEGVRAVLLDKCGNPKWDPPTLPEVTKDKVDWYFSPLPEDRDLFLEPHITVERQK